MGNVIRPREGEPPLALKGFSLRELSVATLAPKPVAGGDADRSAKAPEIDVAAERARAREEGYQAGVVVGAAQTRQELSGTFLLLQTLLAEMHKFRETLLRESEEDLVKLALAIAKKVIREEVKHSSRVVQRMAKEAVGLLADRQELVVRLNPTDMSKLKEAGADPGMLGAAGAKIEFIADSFVTEGGCMVQSKSSTVDADIKTQLDEIETALLRKKHGSEDQSD